MSFALVKMRRSLSFFSKSSCMSCLAYASKAEKDTPLLFLPPLILVISVWSCGGDGGVGREGGVR